MIKDFGIIQSLRETCISKEVSGSTIEFLMNDILLIGNDVEFSGKNKGVFERSFSKKDLGEAAYILSIKIYRDRSRRLISFFNEYIP